MKILFASNNQGKIREVRQILNVDGVEIVTPAEVFSESIEVDETGTTFEENAYLKAKEMGDKSGLITLADDSGLEVDALGGEPGVYSARYADTPEECNQKVIKNLKGIEDKKRTSRFRIAICVYDPRGKNHQTVDGSVEGKITHIPEGENGFGYDPIFYSDVLSKTFAQSSQEEKNQISHRRIALEKAKIIIKKLVK